MVKLFTKVHCKAYMKRIYDGVHVQFLNPDGTYCYDRTVTDYKARAVACRPSEDSSLEEEIADLSEFDGSSVLKTYRERTECEFDGFLVGFTRILVTARIGTDWSDEPYGQEYGYCFKNVEDYPKAGVVYFKNNMKRYVLPEDMEMIKE